MSGHGGGKKLAEKLVAGPVDGDDEFRFGWLLFDFLPNLRHMVVHRSRGRILVITPHIVQKPIATECFAAMLDEVFQEFKFLCGKVERAFVPDGLVLHEVEFDITKAILFDPLVAALDPAQDCLHPGQRGASQRW